MCLLKKPARACGPDQLFLVELPGIEPVPLAHLLSAELLFRYITFPFSPVRYLRINYRS